MSTEQLARTTDNTRPGEYVLGGINTDGASAGLKRSFRLYNPHFKIRGPNFFGTKVQNNFFFFFVKSGHKWSNEEAGDQSVLNFNN